MFLIRYYLVSSLQSLKNAHSCNSLVVETLRCLVHNVREVPACFQYGSKTNCGKLDLTGHLRSIEIELAAKFELIEEARFLYC